MTQWMTPALGTFSALTVMAFVLFFSLVLWILALRFDIHFSYHLQYSISHRPLPPKPAHTSHLYPQSHSHDTYTHILYSTHHASIFFAFILFFSILLYHGLILVSSRSVLHSLFPVCSDRFALIIVFFFFASLLSVLSLSSALLLLLTVRSVLSPYLSLLFRDYCSAG